jgi:membrane protein implicated in regulation of membrane protease activity
MLHLIVSIVCFIIATIFGLAIHGKILGALFGGIIAVFTLVMGFIQFYLFIVLFLIVSIEFYFAFVKTPQNQTKEEKPAETTQKPQNQIEITGAFDKSQFKRK